MMASILFGKVGKLANRNVLRSMCLVQATQKSILTDVSRHSIVAIITGPSHRCFHLSNLTRRKLSDEELANEGPTPYSKSKARDYKATDTFMANTGRPEYQPLILMTSLAVFMVYFFYLREENDIDIMLYQPLEHHIEGMDEEQLNIMIRQSRSVGRNTDELELKQLELRKKRLASKKPQESEQL
ncbi:uncharacterized protein LOC141904244 [Tubulanus polymorphus]|uniref:uncharacterized protein LOC141904244 n=1 Tax=Tubulanus polymorphus TaxID=672921 RepID=UPI003DA35E3B